MEANSLYDLLEQTVIPEYYDRRGAGLPVAWIQRMRESMARLTPHFSANRAVREYTEQHYLPGATAYRQRAAGKGVLGREIADWRVSLDRKWNSLRFGTLREQARPDGREIEVELFLNGLDPNAVRVQLYADAVSDGDGVCVCDMTRVRKASDPSGADLYGVTLSSGRSIGDYTARVLPAHPDVSVPLECARIAWQR
jgi:starch phosphorylase